MKILFVPQAGALGIGGISRCLAVAQEASIWGHEIAFMARPNIKELSINLDFRLFDIITPALPIRNDITPYKLSDHIKIRRMDDVDYLQKTIEHELNIYNLYKPDCVFTEFQFSTAISCRIANIPLVSTISWHTHPNFSATYLGLASQSFDVEKNYNKILKKYKLPEIDNIANLLTHNSIINVAPTIPDLEPQLQDIPNIYYVGALLYSGIEFQSTQAYPISDNDKNIYVYMSVGELLPGFYIPELNRAFARTDFKIFVSLRESTYMNNLLPYRDGNLYIGRMLPGLSIIRRSRVAITRGGQNTLMGCMLAGIPVIGFPGNNAEPDYNVSVLQEHGAAIKCCTADFKGDKLLELVKKVTNEPPFKENAIQLGNKIRTYGGPHSVIKKIQALI